jgi:hypothetical protein
MWKAVVVACFEIAFGKAQGNQSNLQPVYPVCGSKFETETYGIRGNGTSLICEVRLLLRSSGAHLLR